ncbi:YdaS family helix-turn-helix protein [Nitrosomonas supralitoralis]|uniref:YdaS family helix-turn-helix protein n=1 Tax=Nitrosomonas supralitoralis TaxID=2116706 RepID=UPI0015587B4A|nr:YdaS family helix-turn-helix protein [Nitrosomonas supralitoralis]
MEKAIKIVNGQSSLARRISDWLKRNGRGNKIIKQQNVWKWLNHPSGIPTVPPEYRLAIEEITKKQVTCKCLSHDIYGVPELVKHELNNVKETT